MMNTDHVPPPDPEYFWVFLPSMTKVISVDPELTFRVDEIHSHHITGTESLMNQTVRGSLYMNHPVVICKTSKNEPMVTLTLRKIEDGKAYIQVTARSDLREVSRQ